MKNVIFAFSMLVLLSGCRNPLDGEKSGSESSNTYRPGLSTVVSTPTPTPTPDPYVGFTLDIPFVAGNESNYFFNDIAYNSNMEIELNNGKARLKPAAQTDDSSNTFSTATLTGAQWVPGSSYNFVRLDNNLNNAELNASWTPQWSSIASYWTLNGSGSIAGSATIPAVVGNTGTARNAGGTGMAYVSGQVSQGINFDGADDYIEFQSASTLLPSATTTSVTLSLWLKPVAIAADQRVITFSNSAITATNLAIVIGRTSGKISAFFRDGASALIQVDSTNTYTANAWYHVVVTMTNGSGVLYVNGEQQGNSTSVNAANTLNMGAPVTMGSGIGGTTRFTGQLDDFAVWKNVALSYNEVRLLYARQSAKYSGQVVSKIMDAYDATQSWDSFTSVTSLPFYKELPPASSSEVTSAYPAIPAVSAPAPGLSSGLLAYWKMNEATGTNLASSAGTALTATVMNASFTVGTEGKFGYGLHFNRPLTQYVVTPSMNLTNTFTISLWANLKYTTTEWQTLVSNTSTGASSNGFKLAVNSWNTSDGAVLIETGNGTNNLAASTAAGVANLYRWQHYAITVNRTTGTALIYVDGVLRNSSSTSVRTDFNVVGALNIGRATNNLAYTSGRVDEVAVYNRVLSSDEVTQLYRRGANRIKYQIRSCNTFNCANEDLLTTSGQGWQGPDRSAYSYFSELNNNTNAQAMDGTVNSGSLTTTVQDYTSLNGDVNPKRWFQYRAILESDEPSTSTLCDYGAGGAPCSPELRSVRVSPDHYTKTVQSITSKASLGGLPYVLLNTNGFSTPAPVGTCSEEARYALSRDGSTFYYWNGSWTSSSSTYNTASLASDITTNLSSFANLGTGTLQVKTFLKSTGTSPCEVGTLRFTGER